MLSLGVSIAFQANAPLLNEYATPAHAEHDVDFHNHGSEDFDHTEISETEYSHRHSPSEPLHHHHDQDCTSGSALAYDVTPRQHTTVSVFRVLLDVLTPHNLESFNSRSYHPPDRPPRASVICCRLT